jgi:hypothetical protein
MTKNRGSAFSGGFLVQTIANADDRGTPWSLPGRAGGLLGRFKEHPEDKMDAWNNLISYADFPCSMPDFANSLSLYSLLSKLEWRGYSIHEAFKAPQENSQWFTGCISAIKAARHLLEVERFSEVSEKRSQDPFVKAARFLLFKPIIILDGDLFSTELDYNGKIKLKEEPYAPLRFSFHSSNYPEHEYNIDVVTLKSLSEYLKQIEKRQDNIYKELVQMSNLSSK